jgi:integrase
MTSNGFFPDTPPDRIAIQEIADAYLALEVGKLCLDSQRETRRLIALFVKEMGGDRAVSSLRRIDVALWLHSHPEYKSVFMKKNVIARIGRVFSWAMEMELVQKNPFWRLRVDGVRHERRPMTDDEFRALLRRSRPHFRRFLLFLRLTGCRPGEARTLRWQHIDFTRGVAILPEHKTSKKIGKPRILPLVPCLLKMLAWMRVNGHRPWRGRYTTLPATAKLLRDILAQGPVHAREVARRLRPLGISYRMIGRAKKTIGATFRWLGQGKGGVYELPESTQKPAQGDPQEVVFLNCYGTPWDRHTVSRHLRRLCNRLGLPADLSLYTVRHAWATRAIVNGVDIKWVSQVLGHARTAITEAVYIHIGGLIDPLRQAAMDAMKKRHKGKEDSHGS